MRTYRAQTLMLCIPATHDAPCDICFVLKPRNSRGMKLHIHQRHCSCQSGGSQTCHSFKASAEAPLLLQRSARAWKRLRSLSAPSTYSNRTCARVLSMKSERELCGRSEEVPSARYYIKEGVPNQMRMHNNANACTLLRSADCIRPSLPSGVVSQ